MATPELAAAMFLDVCYRDPLKDLWGLMQTTAGSSVEASKLDPGYTRRPRPGNLENIVLPLLFHAPIFIGHGPSLQHVVRLQWMVWDQSSEEGSSIG